MGPPDVGPAARQGGEALPLPGAGRGWYGPLMLRIGDLTIEVLDGDIAALQVDVVVNAANEHLTMAAGLAAELKAAGGQEIEDEAVEKGPIPVGTALVTRAGRLPVRWLIHTAVLDQDLRTDEELVRRSTREALEVADRLGCTTIALPAFGPGAGEFPLAPCARYMAEVLALHTPHSLQHVILAVRGEEARSTFAAELEAVAAEPPPRREGAGYFDLHDD